MADAIYEFGPYRLESATRRLLRDGRPVSLTPKAFDVLVALIERRDRVVDKAELMKLVWPDSFVEEANLSQTIFVLRKTLGDDSNGRPFIETMPRRGYRFVADVHEVARDSAIARAGGRAAKRPRRAAWAIGVVTAVGLVLVGAAVRSRGRAPAPRTDVRVMLAVLPFDNLSGDPAQEYFSNGLTEEMITQLGGLAPEHFGVIARTSAMQYKRTQKTARQIGAEIGADYLLEGSVRRDRDRVRISAQLVHVADQSQVWAANYDRELRDILTVQSDVARIVAQQIQLRLTPQQNAQLRRSRTVNPDAFENYLKGRFFWNKRTVDGHQRALDLFEKALQLDPTYPPTYAGLADTYALLGSAPNVTIARREAMARAREAAQKAISLDESLADAHSSLGFVKMHYDWDFAGAEREFQRAISLNSGYATAHHWYAYDLVALGRLEDAIAEVRRAEKADPLSVIISRDVCEILMFAGHDDEATAQCHKTIEMDPNFGLAHWTLSLIYERHGRHKESIDELRKATVTEGPGPGVLGAFYVRTGRTGEARKLLERLEHEMTTRHGLDFQVAALSLRLGDRDNAFRALERGFRERDGGFIILAVDPVFQAARGDSRFADLLRRVGVVSPDRAHSSS